MFTIDVIDKVIIKAQIIKKVDDSSEKGRLLPIHISKICDLKLKRKKNGNETIKEKRKYSLSITFSFLFISIFSLFIKLIDIDEIPLITTNEIDFNNMGI
ncbi:hypothetical protein [Morganella morganii]|uniref:hypothetical protein n=1 Tax=Morganella morganii TaxID=582 RepID=UPI0034E4D739